MIIAKQWLCLLNNFCVYLSMVKSRAPGGGKQVFGWNILVLRRIHNAINRHKSSWPTKRTQSMNCPLHILQWSSSDCPCLQFSFAAKTFLWYAWQKSLALVSTDHSIMPVVVLRTRSDTAFSEMLLSCSTSKQLALMTAVFIAVDVKTWQA